MNYETIKVSQDGQVLHVLLNRPEAMNAITPQMHDELQHAFDRFASNDDQYVCVISGAGERAFCAGSDLKAIAAGGRPTYPRSGTSGSRIGCRECPAPGR